MKSGCRLRLELSTAVVVDHHQPPDAARRQGQQRRAAEAAGADHQGALLGEVHRRPVIARVPGSGNLALAAAPAPSRPARS